MLYKLNNIGNDNTSLEPVEFYDFSKFGKLEKDLENLIAKNILDLLFEDSKLMPIFQERQYQAEADIYALNENGELVIFELKRSSAGDGAVQQALRYAQDAGQWSYNTLNEKFKQYSKKEIDLTYAHKDAFKLEHELHPKEINNKQHLIIIGSAADDSLISAVDYWKRNGLSIDFLPYRIYDLNGSKFFEFYSPPYDKHINPGETKGVLFDTNRSYDEEAIWQMMGNKRLEAYGEAQRFADHVSIGDIVFFTHKWCGIVAAAKVKGPLNKLDSYTWARDVDFITAIPTRTEQLKYMPFSKISEFTGKSFYWARTIKVPYLTNNESLALLEEVKKYL